MADANLIERYQGFRTRQFLRNERHYRTWLAYANPKTNLGRCPGRDASVHDRGGHSVPLRCGGRRTIVAARVSPLHPTVDNVADHVRAVG